MKAFNPSREERLREKPNIYLIVVESYGRIVMDYPGFSDAYLEHLRHCRDKLETHGFHACSRFSLSPVTGGASWISYTSVMYGLNVKAQSVYLALMKNKHIHEYRSLFWWLKDQGYTTYRLSNLGGYETMKIPYNEYSRMYGFDHWITYQDIGYKGKHYGFGPSPPDQYAICYADQQITAAGTEPFALFFITQNSHTPYESPEKAVDDWRLLLDPGSEMKEPSKFWSKPDFGLYLDAIKYQLDYLTDFISKTGNERDIFILIGDHQPPSLSIPIDNFDTPLHIISKDKEFTELWSEYNFSPGLLCDPALDPIRHEALYTALRRTLIKRFGKKDTPLPVYLPEGIPYPA
jgi:phosphoglycerol transferase MdoB-like AlkP superfamily enzyme